MNAKGSAVKGDFNVYKLYHYISIVAIVCRLLVKISRLKDFQKYFIALSERMGITKSLP